jgi:uncharacterized protein YebE (UPF0316 family)
MEVVLKDLSNVVYFMAYAFGFAAGTYVGLVIEERLSIGTVILRIVTTDESTDEIAAFLEAEHFGVTYLDAQGARGNVRIILTVVNRIDVSRITEHIERTNPKAFFSIEDIRYVSQGVFRPRAQTTLSGIFDSLVHAHKRK